MPPGHPWRRVRYIGPLNRCMRTPRGQASLNSRQKHNKASCSYHPPLLCNLPFRSSIKPRQTKNNAVRNESCISMVVHVIWHRNFVFHWCNDQLTRPLRTRPGLNSTPIAVYRMSRCPPPELMSSSGDIETVTVAPTTLRFVPTITAECHRFLVSSAERCPSCLPMTCFSCRLKAQMRSHLHPILAKK